MHQNRRLTIEGLRSIFEKSSNRFEGLSSNLSLHKILLDTFLKKLSFFLIEGCYRKLFLEPNTNHPSMK
jgi:hypothetical protein